MKYYTNKEICALIEAESKWLTHLAVTGVVEPSIQEADGRGTNRKYGCLDILKLIVVQELERVGLKRRAVSSFLKEEFPLLQRAVIARNKEWHFAPRGYYSFIMIPVYQLADRWEGTVGSFLGELEELDERLV